MTSVHYQIAETVARRFNQLPEVEAVAVAGSVVTGRSNASSDVDVYIYPTVDIPVDMRLSIGREFAKDVQVVDYWGPALVWFDPASGIEVEALFFNTRWMDDLVLQPLEQHQARTGYTTCFWHTVRVSKVLFDRTGWFAGLQAKAAQPYPDGLVQAIVNLNYPLLRDVYPSYRAQLLSAMQRQDLMVVNKRVGEFLDSYFDILFAVNRMPHPGVKRMLTILETECEKRPQNMTAQVTRLLTQAGGSSGTLIDTVDALVDGLSDLLRGEGWL